MAALAAGIIFGFCRYFVLRHADAERRAIYVAPPLVFLTAFINVYFVFTKGAKKTIVAQNPGWTDRTSVWVSFLIAVGAGLITLAAVPWMRRKILAAEEKKQRDAEERIEMAERAARDALEAEKRKQDSDGTEEEEEGEGQGQGGKEGGKKTRRDYMQMAKKALLHGVTVDIHEIVKTDATVANIHSTAEVFDTRAESIFSYLQVFSAICVMFAHGAAEVGYMSGPLSSIYDIYMNERVDRKLIAPVWITFISAFSLVVGEQGGREGGREGGGGPYPSHSAA
jgi:sodium-dependent phosphate transporter